jgi:hypothetical protein
VHPLVAYALLGIGGFRMTDRGVYLLLGLLILALAGAEVVYAMVGPFSEPTQQDDQFGTINPVRGKIVQCSRVDHEFQSSSRPAHSDVAAIGPFARQPAMQPNISSAAFWAAI